MTLNIIHLPHRYDRLVLLKKEMQEQRIEDYRIWKGIVCPGKPETGISMAHKRIVQHAMKNELSEILIGEDDLHFTAEGAFNHFMEQKPVEYDLYLGGISHGRLSDDKRVDDFAGLMFYMVHERFYETFLSIDEERHLDRVLKHKGIYVVCDPQPVIEHSTYSDNLDRWIDSSIFFKNRNLFGRRDHSAETNFLISGMTKK